MKRSLNVHLSIFIKAMENLGYRREWIGFRGWRKSWRKDKFHVEVVAKTAKRLIVELHVDVPKYKVGQAGQFGTGTGLSHYSRDYGSDISMEFKRIMQELRKLESDYMRRKKTETSYSLVRRGG